MAKNKTILCLGVLAFVFGTALTSCGPTSNPTTPTTEPSTEPSVSVPDPFVSDVESNLVMDEDYVEHSKTYGDGKYSYDPAKWYVNDLDKVPLPDPHVFYEDGKYYITGTSDTGNARFLDMYVTEDFNYFEYKGKIYDPANYKGWEANPALLYAPEVYCFDGVYYLYYSAISRHDGVRYMSVVSSNNILGPYAPIVNDEVDGLNNPLFVNGTRTALDATIFTDTDGKMYMYYSVAYRGQYCAGVELENPYTAKWDTYKELVFPGPVSTEETEKLLDWECWRGSDIAEAPYMIKSQGKYYLTYSVNGCWNKYYNVCYAVSDTPLGNFVKPYREGELWTNLLLGYPGPKESDDLVYNQWSGFASGTGHHCFFYIGDQIMIGYHAHRNRDWNSDSDFTQRYFAMDYLHFDKDGVPYVNGPSWSPQPLPEAISGYKNIAPNATIRSENITQPEVLNDQYIVDCYNLPGELEKEATIGKGLAYVELTFDKEYKVGGFSIYNTSNYNNAFFDIKYVDFGNGNAVKDLTFNEAKFINLGYEFIHPMSAFTVEFNNDIKATKMTICFELSYGGALNEISILGY